MDESNTAEDAETPKVLQLKIELLGIKPEIWRRFLVEDSITFRRLHGVIQKVMEWENYHMYEFVVGDVRIEDEAKPELFRVDAMFSQSRRGQERKTLPAGKTLLGELLKQEGRNFGYVYDFGDNWRHSIKVEKILEKDASLKYPLCVAGERACPPEDCGSTFGYEELMEIRKNSKHPEYKERIVYWLGVEYDPERFDPAEVNDVLAGMRGGRKPGVWVRRKIGRNDPCPCGSGKKYKKCCLRINE